MSAGRDIRFWGALFGVFLLIVSQAGFPMTPRTASSGAQSESFVDVPEMHDVPLLTRERRGDPGSNKAPDCAAEPPDLAAATTELAPAVHRAQRLLKALFLLPALYTLSCYAARARRAARRGGRYGSLVVSMRKSRA